MAGSDSNTPRLIDIPFHEDERGTLGIVEAGQIAGFDFKRVYYFAQNAADKVQRGAHAHKSLRQFVVCLRGAVTISLEGRYGKQVFRLDNAFKGLLVPPGSWRDLYDFSDGSLVMVFASAAYDEEDYIRDYDAFLKTLTEEAQGPVPYVPMARMCADMGGAFHNALGHTLAIAQFIGGDPVKQFEDGFAAYCGARYAVGCGNGLDALALLLEACGIGPGDEVIVPANSFIATALAVNKVGATPVFADCNPKTYGIQIDGLEALITDKTKAIIPVHLYGIAADMTPLMALAEKHQLKIIEDAAQAHGASYKGKRAGSLGHAAAFSFYPTKNLGALGDGGAITTDDEALAKRVRLLGNYGSVKKYHHDVQGWNTRLDTLQAGFLSAKLPRLEGWNQRRRALVEIYREMLANVAGIMLPQIPDNSEAAWHVFPIFVKDGKRDALQAHLDAAKIGTLVHYPVPIHKQKAYADIGRAYSLPVSEAASDALLSLPLDPYHSDAEIRYVAQTVKAFF